MLRKIPAIGLILLSFLSSGQVKSPQTITFNPLPVHSYNDSPFGLTASASSGLAVSYTSSNTGVATIVGNTVTIHGVGESTITARQAGNATFDAAPDVTQTLTVNKANQSITFGTLASRTYGGSSFPLTATASSGLPVSFSSSDPSILQIVGSNANILGAGTVVVTAIQEGDFRYNAAPQAPRSQFVNKATQSISLTFPVKTYGDAPFTVSATATSGLSVKLNSDNATVATLSGNIVTIVGAGTSNIGATQAGDNNYFSTTTSLVLTVLKANQSITFTSLPSRKVGYPFTLTATSSAGLPIVFSSSKTSVIKVSGNTATINGPGTSVIKASQSGNGNYNAAPDVLQPQIVTDLGNVYPLWGGLRNGGAGQGAIYAVNSDGTSFAVNKSFPTGSFGLPQSGFIKATDGKLYGTASFGGNGSVLRINPDGTGYETIHSFHFSDGQQPFCNLLQANNGLLYGTTLSGGNNNTGVVFRMELDGSNFTILYDFPGGTLNGYHALGSVMQASDGDLYGMTKEGGTTGVGVLYKIKLDGSGFQKLVDFDGPTNGSYPRGDLVQGSDTFLYGLTMQGGTSNKGTMFKIKSDGTQFTKLIDFDGPTRGANPGASLIVGSDSFLYGMTQAGGANGLGVIFKVATNGSGFTKIFDFDGTPSGSAPAGTLTESSDGNLYGMTYSGGSSNLGTAFKIQKDGNNFVKLHDFLAATGSQPVFGPLLEESPGRFVSFTAAGGASNTGLMFSISATGTYSVVKEFPQLESHPEWMTGPTTDNFFVGVTSNGGNTGSGAFFKVSAEGSNYEKLVDIESPAFAFVEKIYRFSNGKIWGTGREGVIGFNYFLFRMDEDGSNFQRVIVFDNPDQGFVPKAMLELPDGTIVVGTQSGGAASAGLLFKMNSDGSNVIRLANVPGGTGGQVLTGNLLYGSDGKIYGVTHEGGSNNAGTVFSCTLSGTYTKILDLNGGQTGVSPNGIFEMPGGEIGITCRGGGANNSGTLFYIDKDGSHFTKVYDFSTSSGSQPTASVFQSVDGNIYGTAENGGASGNGTIYKMAADGSNFSIIHDFASTEGGQPNTLFFEKSGQTLTLPAIPVKTAIDAPFLLQFASSSGVSPQFSISDPTIATISGGTVTLTGKVGSAVISAVVAGSVNFTASNPAQQTLTVVKAGQAISFPPVNSAVLGAAPFNLNASSTSNLALLFSSTPAGRITIAGNMVTTVAPGKVTIKADQPGNDLYLPASPVQQTICINPAKPTITTSAPVSGSTTLSSSATSSNSWYKNGVLLVGENSQTLTVQANGLYAVKVIVDQCESELSNDVNVVITGLEESVARNLSVYPVPATGPITFEVPTSINSYTLSIYTPEGKKIFSTQGMKSEINLDISSWPTGIYILRVDMQEKILYKRFTKI